MALWQVCVALLLRSVAGFNEADYAQQRGGRHTYTDVDVLPLPSRVEQVLLPVAVFFVENAFSLSVATSMFLVFCLLTRLFMTETEEDQESKPLKKGSEPNPRWEVLQVLNYLFIGVFVSSVCYVVFNYRRMAHEGNSVLLPHFFVWCLCMVYFFGFFGISFLDKSALVRSPSSFGLSHLDQHLSGGYLEQRPMGMCAREVPQMYSKAPPSPPLAPQVPQQRPAAPVAAKPSPKAVSGLASALAPQGEDYASMTDEQVVACVLAGGLKDHQLEVKLGDHFRAVRVRRQVFEQKVGTSLEALPHQNYDYERIFGANCEIVCGYIQLPVGILGPLLLDGKEVYVPMATTEGCLVASTNRGCKVISQSGGCSSVVLKDGITRAPCLRMPSAVEAARLKAWVEEPVNFEKVREAFQSTTSFGKLKEVKVWVAGRNVFLRVVCFAGDAMGMNMVSKGCLAVIDLLRPVFPEMELIAISGNMCTDKKSAAVNWIEGRGKSVVCEARIPAKHVESTLKTTVKAMVETNIQKNLVGSAMAGALGGFNAHASNIVTAVFLATGQDPAQNVESSSCITLMEQMDNGDLLVSVTMPSIEVGTVGGGTSLPAQATCLDVMGCRGASKAPLLPGDNAKQLARVVAGSVLAGELSLIAALSANHLVSAHMTHNRKKA